MHRVLLTGVGSLPVRSWTEALVLETEFALDVPHLPQLPAKGRNYGMLLEMFPQSFSALVTESDDFELCLPQNLEEIFPEAGESPFRSAILALKQYVFEKSPAIVKCQCVGPVTWLAFLFYDNTWVMQNERIRALLLDYMEQEIRWAVSLLQPLCRSMVWIFDEPYLEPLVRNDSYALLARESLQHMLHMLQAEGVQGGVHNCSAQHPKTLSELEWLSVYSFDVKFAPAKEVLDVFYENGTRLSLGVDCTSQNNIEKIALQIKQQFGFYAQAQDSFGAFWLTPSCGLGKSTEDAARRTYAFLRALQELFNERTSTSTI